MKRTLNKTYYIQSRVNATGKRDVLPRNSDGVIGSKGVSSYDSFTYVPREPLTHLYSKLISSGLKTYSINHLFKIITSRYRTYNFIFFPL